MASLLSWYHYLPFIGNYLWRRDREKNKPIYDRHEFLTKVVLAKYKAIPEPKGPISDYVRIVNKNGEFGLEWIDKGVNNG
jgi:hypothetical protein